MERKSLTLFFTILLVLFATQEMMVPAEAKVCEVLSGKFSGPCIGNDRQCDNVCRRIEGVGFFGGRCKGLQCYCKKNC
ncbi:defensin J1-1-like [Malania oleifera]|uniref:defensin J1-1-like n=1 Tax=Malania oleifera TaxID=397392 RepID=UPI0025AE72D6|nr:defensin J1-1-like [Malania oleifera]